MKNKFFFIFGSKRGGTTFLRLLLNSHKDISIPRESHFLSGLFYENGKLDLVNTSNKNKIYNQILKSGRFDTWNMTSEELKETVFSAAEDSSLSDLIVEIFSKETGKLNNLLGDKTPEYIDHVDEIRNLFPDAKFIFLVRDPRDVSDSLHKRGWEGWTHFHRGLYLNRVLKIVSRYKDQKNCYLLRYEDLVSDPEKSLKKVVSFLELPYDENMVKFQGSAREFLTEHELKSGVHKNITKEPSTDDVAKWKKRPAQQYFFLEKVCEKSMQQFNYVPMLIAPKFLKNGLMQRMYIVFLYSKVGAYHAYKGLVPHYVKSALVNSRIHSRLKTFVQG